MAKPSKLDKAKVRVVTTHPFYAAILLRRPLVADASIKTMAIDAKGVIYYNPEWTESLTVEQLVFVLCHECLHRMLNHAGREGSRNHKRWNTAGDAVINDMLRTQHVGEWIEGGVDMPGSKDRTTEAVYNDLPEDEGGGGGGGGGDGPGGIGDDIIPGDGPGGEPLTPEQLAQIATEVQQEVAEAAQAAKVRGCIPAGMEELVEDILSVRTPWFEILERFMTERSNSDYTWSRPNRRHIHTNTYLPSINSEGALGEVVIGVDTSGSVSDKEMAAFAGHVNRILELTKPSKVHVVYCDARVAHVDEVTPDDLPLQLTRHGGGGTAFEPVFEWVREQAIDPTCLIYLTDGYGDQAYLTDPGYPVCWLITSTYTDGFEFGEIVLYDEND
jgi:predicted metal-dependent peptidase